MRKLLLITNLLLTFVIFTGCSSDDDEIISVNELPEISQTFLTTHFTDENVKLVKKDGDSYEVYLNNEFKIEFNLSGEWNDINGYGKEIPVSILTTLPQGITDHINTNYPQNFVIEISKESYGFEVELSNLIDLMFKDDGTYIGIDK